MDLANALCKWILQIHLAKPLIAKRDQCTPLCKCTLQMHFADGILQIHLAKPLIAKRDLHRCNALHFVIALCKCTLQIDFANALCKWILQMHLAEPLINGCLSSTGAFVFLCVVCLLVCLAFVLVWRVCWVQVATKYPGEAFQDIPEGR